RWCSAGESFQPRLFPHALERARLHILGRMSRDHNDARFGRMFENSMAALVPNDLPAVVLKPFQHVANFHYWPTAEGTADSFSAPAQTPRTLLQPSNGFSRSWLYCTAFVRPRASPRLVGGAVLKTRRMLCVFLERNGLSVGLPLYRVLR